MITFKYKKEPTGKSPRDFIKRPVADVFIKSTSGEWIEFHPYIDSGADLTLIPLSLGKLLGFTVNEKKIEQIGGIRGSVPIINFKNLMRIGDKEIEANIAWALVEEVPPLLGRTSVFDNFDIKFRQKRGLIEFQEDLRN